jgi:hypothetical protein
MIFVNRAAAFFVGTTLLALVTAVPAPSVAAAAAAEAAGPECSAQTLRGDYAFEIDGTILAGPAPILIRGLAMTRFDGEGGLTQVDTATFNGVPAWPGWRPATGTYEVNADCTGSAEIVPAAPAPSLRLRLVVFDGGRRVTTIVEGNATGSRGVRVK